MDAVKKYPSTRHLLDVVLKAKLETLIQALVKLYRGLLLGSCTVFAS
jgi:hypothetical protein